MRKEETGEMTGEKKEEKEGKNGEKGSGTGAAMEWTGVI
jgi:hypothetical protein